MIKKVYTPEHQTELEILRFFSSSSLSTKDDNFCVPIYDTLRIPDHPEFVLIVMPLLRRWNQIPFETLGEVVDFCQQAFMVSQEIFHLIYK